jgi:excisionase family DNA binding protein
MSIEGYLTVNEAGDLKGVSGSRIRQFISEGRLDSIKVGNLRLVKKTDVEALEIGRTGRPKDENPSKNALAQRKYRENK